MGSGHLYLPKKPVISLTSKCEKEAELSMKMCNLRFLFKVTRLILKVTLLLLKVTQLLFYVASLFFNEGHFKK